MVLPRGSKHLIIKELGLKYHIYYGFWDQTLNTLGIWTLWVWYWIEAWSPIFDLVSYHATKVHWRAPHIQRQGTYVFHMSWVYAAQLSA